MSKDTKIIKINKFMKLSLKMILLNFARCDPRILSSIKFEPNRIQISVTNRCCCKCIMCDYWKLNTTNELDIEEIKNILNQAREIGVKTCNLYGGEPMMRRDIFELIEYANNLGFEVEMISNGFLIDKTNAKKLARSGLKNITISIDAIGDVHDEIRGVRGAYNKAILAIQELRKNNVRVTIGTLLMKKTLKNKNILKLIKLMKNLGFPVFIQLIDFSFPYFKDDSYKNELWIEEEDQEELEDLISKLIVMKKGNPKLIINSISSLEYIKKYFIDPKRADIPCYFIYSGRLWVDSSGKLYTCQGLPPVGDLRTERLKDIIFSEKYNIGLRKAFMKKCPGCSCGYSTNANSHFPFIMKYLAEKLKYQ